MLSKILERLGVKDYSELKEQERQLYLQWAEILSKPDFTIDDLKKLLPVELTRANHQLRDYENSDKKELFFKAYTRILQMLTDIITVPKKEREELKKRLEKQFNL